VPSCTICQNKPVGERFFNIGKPTERNSRYYFNSVFNYLLILVKDRLEGNWEIQLGLFHLNRKRKLQFPTGFYRKLLLKLIFNQIFQIVWLSGEHALLPSNTPISGYRLHIVLWLA